MELKELILSTLEELDEKIAEDSAKAQAILEAEEARVEAEIQAGIEAAKEEEAKHVEEKSEPDVDEQHHDNPDDEVAFLEHSKERLLVLFEGLQAEETKNLEAKLDITLNFLEYYLAKIEERLEEKA
jgi:hypothetical protein